MGSRIFAAAALGDIRGVDAELKRDAELLLSNCKGRTLMHVAAMHGHTELVSWLVHDHPRVAQYVTECELHGRTPLHLAALNGKTDVVVELLKVPGVDPMCRDHNMHTPLLLAAMTGHLSVVIELLKGPKHQQLQQLNAANGHGHTALHLAVRCEHLNIVQHLLRSFEAEQVIDQLICKDNLGWTPVHSAAGMGKADIINEIFKVLCNPFIFAQVNDTVWSVLHVASWLGDAETVELMCEKMDFDVNVKTQNLEHLTPLHMAANNGHDAVVDVLLKQGKLQVGDCDALRRTALHYAAKQGNSSVVRKLLLSFQSKSRDRSLVNATDVNGLTALHLAARGGHEQVVCILLEEGANVNVKTEYSMVSKSLLDAILNSNPSHETIIEPMILEADCCCISQMTPLHLAAKNGHVKVVRQLLKHSEVNVGALDGHGLMAQDWAEVREIKKDFLDSLEQAPQSAGETSARVRKKKVQVLRENIVKWEKLMAAIMLPSTFHSFQSMQYMTEASEDLDKMCKCGNQDGQAFNSPEKDDTRDLNLRSTPYVGHLDTRERLLQENYEITEQEERSRNTPLHVAVKHGNRTAVEFLLKHGSMDDTNAKNSEGCTPLALAFENNHVEICKMILQSSEKVEDDLDEMLKTAISREWLDMGVLLVGDARTRMDGGIGANLLDEASLSAGKRSDEASHSAHKSILDALLRRTTIKERLLQERKEHLDSAGAMLVIAALISSITYQGGLQSPQEKHRQALVLFDWLNAMAFYSAVATTIAVASGSLPIRHMYELVNARDPMQMSRGISCVLLIMSSTCVVWAYAAAGFNRASYKKPFSFGNVGCAIATTLFLFLFLKYYIQLYEPFCHSTYSRSNGQQHEGYICIMCRKIAEIVQKLPTKFSRQKNDGLEDNLLQHNATVAV